MSCVVHKVLLLDRELLRRVVDGSRIVQKSRPSLRFVEGYVELFRHSIFRVSCGLSLGFVVPENVEADNGWHGNMSGPSQPT